MTLLREAYLFRVQSFYELGSGDKVWSRGGGRDLTGSPKILDEKHWAIKLLQVISMGHESFCFRICFNILQILSSHSTSFLLFS